MGIRHRNLTTVRLNSNMVTVVRLRNNMEDPLRKDMVHQMDIRMPSFLRAGSH